MQNFELMLRQVPKTYKLVEKIVLRRKHWEVRWSGCQPSLPRYGIATQLMWFSTSLTLPLFTIASLVALILDLTD